MAAPGAGGGYGGGAGYGGGGGCAGGWLKMAPTLSEGTPPLHCYTATRLTADCCTTTLPHCHTATLPHCHTATLLHCYTTAMLHCCTASLLHCHTATLPHCCAPTPTHRPSPIWFIVAPLLYDGTARRPTPAVLEARHAHAQSRAWSWAPRAAPASPPEPAR